MPTYQSTEEFAEYLHDSMRDNEPLDDIGTRAEFDSWARHDANFCLTSACTYAQPDKIRLLINEYGADPHCVTTTRSDRHKGVLENNLLHETLSAYLYRPDVDRSPEGQARYAETVRILLTHGVSASLNPDPYDNPVRDAWLIAHPEAAVKNDSALADDWVLATFPPDFEGFAEPLELIRQHQPQAVAAFEQQREQDNQKQKMAPSSKAEL